MYRILHLQHKIVTKSWKRSLQSMETSKCDHAVLYYINKNELQGEPAIYDYNICWGGNQTFTEKIIHQ